MIKVEGIRKSFSRKEVLRGVSFSVAQDEILGIVGPSGAGKSVLLKILGGVMSPDSGTVQLEGKRSKESLANAVGFLFQEGALFDSMSVLENVAFPLTCVREQGRGAAEGKEVSQERAYALAYEVLEQVGLGAAWKKLPGQLSGGMRRRVALARALVHRPELVLLDDPTGGLDPVAASVIVNLIVELKDRYNPAVVLVSHDIRRLLPNVDRVLALFDGQISCDLPPNELQRNASPEVVSFLETRFDFSLLSPQAS